MLKIVLCFSQPFAHFSMYVDLISCCQEILAVKTVETCWAFFRQRILINGSQYTCLTNFRYSEVYYECRNDIGRLNCVKQHGSAYVCRSIAWICLAYANEYFEIVLAS